MPPKPITDGNPKTKRQNSMKVEEKTKVEITGLSDIQIADLISKFHHLHHVKFDIIKGPNKGQLKVFLLLPQLYIEFLHLIIVQYLFCHRKIIRYDQTTKQDNIF